MTTQETEELTDEQKAYIAVLRKKFFRAVSVLSVLFIIIILIVLRFTVYNLKTVHDYEQYINDKDKFIRFNTAKALGSFKGSPEATKVLIQMLDDQAREVRWHAAASLSKLRDPASVPKLLLMLNSEKDISAKSIYIYALGQIKDERALKPLDEILNNESSEISPNDTKILKFSVIQALASFGNNNSEKILTDFENKKSTSGELKDFSSKMRVSKGIQESLQK